MCDEWVKAVLRSLLVHASIGFSSASKYFKVIYYILTTYSSFCRKYCTLLLKFMPAGGKEEVSLPLILWVSTICSTKYNLLMLMRHHIEWLITITFLILLPFSIHAGYSCNYLSDSSSWHTICWGSACRCQFSLPTKGLIIFIFHSQLSAFLWFCCLWYLYCNALF